MERPKRRKEEAASKPDQAQGKEKKSRPDPESKKLVASEERKPTEFQERVHAAVRAIPAGKVATYGDIAKQVGCGSAQAIGQVMRHNPFPATRYTEPYPDIMVPCHRVVATSRALGGFCGATDPNSSDMKRKVSLLRSEGVILEGETCSFRVSKASMWNPSLPKKKL